MEPVKASDDLMSFFKNLLDIKERIRLRAEELKDEELQSIYDFMHRVIKATEGNNGQ